MLYIINMVNMKICNKCGKSKGETEFYKRKISKDGLQSICKICNKEKDKEYRKRNKEKIKKIKQEYYRSKEDYFKEKNLQHYHQNKERISERHREYYQKNKEKIKKRVENRYNKMPTDKKEKLLKQGRVYGQKYRLSLENKIKIKKRRAKYRSKPEIKKHRTEYARKRRHNPEFRNYFKDKWAEDRTKRKHTHKNIILMPNPFPSEIEVDYHHLLNDFYDPGSKLFFMWAMPRITHNYVYGSTTNRGHWKHNAEWIKKLYCIDIKKLLSGY